MTLIHILARVSHTVTRPLRWRSYVPLMLLMVICALPPVARAGLVFDGGELGVAGLAQPGGRVRFVVTLRADAQGAQGSLSCSAGYGRVERAVDIPPLGALRWEGSIHLPALAGEAVVEYQAADGKTSAFPMPLILTVTSGDVGILAVTTRRGTMAAVDRRPAADWLGAATFRTGDLIAAETASLADLPRAWSGWAGVDVVVWTGIDPRSPSLRADQQEALLRWVARGGSLICVDDGLMDGWSGSFLGARLPTDPTTRQEAVVMEERARVLVGPRRADADAVLTVGDADAQIDIVTVRRLGFGRVVYVAAAPRALTPAGEAELWRFALGAAIPPDREVAPPATSKSRERLLTRLRAGSGNGSRLSAKTRRLMVTTGSWLVVIVALGVWNVRYRPRFGWIVVVLAAGIACAVPIALRSRTRFVTPREVGVLRVFPDIGAGYWYGVVSVPPMEERELRAEFSADLHVLPLEERNRMTTWVSDPSKGGGELRKLSPDTARRTYWHGQAFVPSYGRVTLSDPGDTQREAAAGSDETITNHTTLTFERGLIVQGERGAVVGPLAPGESGTYRLDTILKRRRFWSQLEIPEAVYGHWAREGVFDAFADPKAPTFFGWTRGVVVLGSQTRPSPDNVLLLIAPLDTKADGEAPRSQNR
jgi:hypothetical protein